MNTITFKCLRCSTEHEMFSTNASSKTFHTVCNKCSGDVIKELHTALSTRQPSDEVSVKKPLIKRVKEFFTRTM